MYGLDRFTYVQLVTSTIYLTSNIALLHITMLENDVYLVVQVTIKI